MNEQADRRSEELDRLTTTARRKVSSAIAKQERLMGNLRSDLSKHGEPEQWKRFGDLLLANVGTARREGDSIFVTDYFDPAASTVAIPGEARRELTEVAEDYFRLYTKARNGKRIILERLTAAEKILESEKQKLASIEAAVAAGDIEALRTVTAAPVRKVVSRPSKKDDNKFKGARRFLSSDGFEILVGKKAADNDHLTFRIARSLDLWLHAADYPGSHVVVRSSGRLGIPDRTLVEAAQLAAFYSDAREHPKAAVHYTQKKFVNKPKGGTPGLVSLASFRTVLVEPKIAVEAL